ncbi:MAG: conjugal transfer protein, partial [Sphingomonas sp.]
MKLLRFLTLLLGAFVLSTTLSPRAEAQSKCSGKFVNPITDVCWSCLFPLSVGGLKI